jgi:hypothetical protein
MGQPRPPRDEQGNAVSDPPVLKTISSSDGGDNLTGEKSHAHRRIAQLPLASFVENAASKQNENEPAKSGQSDQRNGELRSHDSLRGYLLGRP